MCPHLGRNLQNMKCLLKRFSIVCAAVSFLFILSACGESAEEAFLKWRNAALDDDDEIVTELTYINPEDRGISEAHYTALMRNQIKNNAVVRERFASMKVKEVEETGEDTAVLTVVCHGEIFYSGDEIPEDKQEQVDKKRWKYVCLSALFGTNCLPFSVKDYFSGKKVVVLQDETEIKVHMRKIDGKWKVAPLADVPLQDFKKVVSDEKEAESAGPAPVEEQRDEIKQSNSAPDTTLTGGETDFDKASEDVQIDFANE